uniref:receptor-type tyrosine-protein phosphatase eta-like n=1 Tax=Euleptes europaea TaxID=460621 RepID=UPI0025409832|nr:receptor-type tyrosine-protein phosphatase eta-like [Euleptes europaea]
MRRLARLCVLLALCLGEIKVLAACDECSSVTVTATNREIYIQNPDNFTITNVTFANGTLFKDGPLNDSVSDLEPGVQYIVTFQNDTFQNETEICCKNITTVPTQVIGISFSDITNQSVNLMWSSSDPNAAVYSYRIVVDGGGSSTTENSTNTTAVISNLKPGTLYTFTIYPQVAETEGDAKNGSTYTIPSSVFNITATDISSVAVDLSWENRDTASPMYSYRIHISRENGSGENKTARSTRVAISQLTPGTNYTFSIYSVAADNTTEGNPDSISLFTIPSSVFNITATDISSVAVDLSWENRDTASPMYSYRIHISRENGSGENKTARSTRVAISQLTPGTNYTFSIYSVAADNTTEGNPDSISRFTKPSPVTDIRFSDIMNQSVNLMWSSSDPNAADYSYRIVVDGTNITEYSTNTTAVINNLEPGTLYTFTIYPQVAGTEGDPNNSSNYTKPNPVFDVQIKNYNTTTVLLTWNNTDAARHGYTYVIETGEQEVETVRNTSTTIGNLEPGTEYTFTIYSQAGDGKTRGDPVNTSTYTIPSSVFNITATDISSVAVDLSWENRDTASPMYSYRIHISRENGSGENKTARSTRVAISQLTPGTNYTFSIYSVAADNTTEGNPDSISLFTKPSAVSKIIFENISTNGVILSWSIEDAAASGYTYRIYIQNGSSAGWNVTQSSSSKNASIQGLNPGTSYSFSVFARVNSGKTEGGASSQTVCTDAAPVGTLNCKPVLKQPELNLSWSPPEGIYNSFTIQVSNGTLNRSEQYSSENQGAIIKDLSYFVNYTVRIVTHSCGEMSIPQDKICLTSITDPPVPSEIPTAEATSHNTLKVQFSPFESINGPLEAYAVIITTSKEMKCSNESLADTYQDFTEKKTDSYVACVKDVQHSSKVDRYDISIGDGLTYHGYYNGKLEPLGSYRACVAGFTRIIFTNDSSVSSRESYVSYSAVSAPAHLPQNPDVITGAVVGCILGAVLVAAIAVFIFWKKRRKGGKNNEVPFSPIAPKKSKLIKVENFESYFKKQKADSNCGFAEEYEDLRPVGVNQPKFAAELQENKGKNRYNNVLPYDISRVKLSIQNHPTNDYINANYMPGYNSKKEFIAAQGPLPNTVQDFWRMIWEKSIHTIVMLTKCIEQGRTKCEEYWPNKQSKNYGDITVSMTSEIILPEWTIRDFSMEKSDSSVSHPVRQFHFTAWPDHGAPETTDLLISFRHLVQEYMKQNPPTPTLVHCSAGVGRTGTFIAIDRLIHQMEMENTVDVYGSVYDLRMHRPLMVQTEEQYVFLNQCVMDIIKTNKEKKADLIYQNTNAMAIYENFRPSPHLGKANGYHV